MSRGRFYLRCESDEWDFLRALDSPLPFDAAVVSDRYLAAYPESHKRHGEDRDLLTKALDDRGVHWSVDPDTARLEQRSSIQRQRPRAANRPVAKALPLPLTVDQLRHPEALDALVEANTLHQTGSKALVAPYFEVTGLDDPRWDANRRMLRRTGELAGDRIVVAYLQVLRSDLLNGNAAATATAIADCGAQVIFVRVRRVDPELATPEEVIAYAGVIEAGTQAGCRVVGDCVGRLGPVLIATGADGFATNAWRFRKVPEDLHPSGGGGGAGELLWEVPRMGFGISASAAKSDRRCPAPGCPAPDGPTSENLATRIHNLHEFHGAAKQAAKEGLRYAVRLARSPSPTTRGWASALQQLARRAA
jgi:hypothetical protein